MSLTIWRDLSIILLAIESIVVLVLLSLLVLQVIALGAIVA